MAFNSKIARWLRFKSKRSDEVGRGRTSEQGVRSGGRAVEFFGFGMVLVAEAQQLKAKLMLKGIPIDLAGECDRLGRSRKRPFRSSFTPSRELEPVLVHCRYRKSPLLNVFD